jgi:murein DD-endopeptidase MepM/ murein hydrolase activator NlpD
MHTRLSQFSLWLFTALVLAGCAPKWEPPPGYRGGFLVGADTPRAVTVQKGDSVYLIARRYNVPMKALIEANGMQPPYVLQPGQVLRIDPPLVHVVQRGDSLYAISRRYGVDMRALAQKNPIRPPFTIFPGQQLLVPDNYTSATAVAQASPEAPQARSSRTRDSASPSASSNTPVAPPAPPARAGSRFVWPVEGNVVAKFGPSGKGLHNDGINIAVREGTDVRAAENGVVAYSGNELQGFGNLLLIKHADGWMTAYAHNQSLLVKRGDQVRRGQVISRAGKSGNVRSPQLHFELRRGTRAVNPLDYLDSRAS